MTKIQAMHKDIKRQANLQNHFKSHCQRLLLKKNFLHKEYNHYLPPGGSIAYPSTISPRPDGKKSESRSVVSDSVRSPGLCSLPGSSVHRFLQSRVGCHFPLQGI